jgi:hypothetical protein
MYEDTARPCRPDAYVIISELVGWEGEVRGGRGSATYLGDPSSLGTVAGLSDARHSSLGTFSVRRRHCGRPYVGASERTSLMWPYLEEGAAMDADDDLQAAVSVSKIPCKWGTERIEVRLKSESQQCPGQELLLTVYSTILLPEPHIRPHVYAGSVCATLSPEAVHFAAAAAQCLFNTEQGGDAMCCAGKPFQFLLAHIYDIQRTTAGVARNKMRERRNYNCRLGTRV